MKQNIEQYDQLLDKKEELLKEYNILNQVLVGAENPENTKKIAELEIQKSLLKDKLISLEKNILNTKAQIKKIEEEKKDISLEKETLLFKAMENQRWFFFENRRMFLFDRESGYIWTNLDYFPLKNLNYKDAKEEIKELEWHGLGNWKLPTFNEMKLMIKDKSFPFQEGKYYLIKRKYYWVYSNGRMDMESISKSDSSFLTNIGYYIPCNTKYATNKFSKTNSKFKDIPYGAEKAMVELFLKEGWIPKFEDSKITEIFKAYAKRYNIIDELKELENRLKELEPKTKRLSQNFDFKHFLVEYNQREIDSSIIEYVKASIKWIDDLIEGLDSFQKEKESLFSYGIKIKNTLSSSYNLEGLSKEESQFLNNHNKLLIEKFDFGMEDLTNQLLEFKEESINIANQIRDIKNSKNKLIALAEIKEQTRPNFYFFAEYTGGLVKEKLRDMDWFEEHQDYIQKVLKLREGWLDDYDIFINKRQRDFYRFCEEEMIEEEDYKLWFEEWRKKRFLILSKIFELVTRVDTLPPNAILKIFEFANEYISELDKFYKSERIAIHQNPKFTGLLEKYEKEKELSKITNKFQEDLEKIIFGLERTQEKIFLARWAKDWISTQIDEVIQYIERDNLIDTTLIFKKIFDEFKELEKNNLEHFLNDIRAYEKARKKQEKNYNSLLHKMTVELKKLEK